MSDQNRQMFPATCSTCGQDCQVPFKPSTDKPILCRDCYRQRSGGGSSGSNSNVQRELQQINAKLDTILKILNK